MPKAGKEPRGYDSGPSDSKIRAQSKFLSALIAATGRVYEDIPFKKVTVPTTVSGVLFVALWLVFGGSGDVSASA